MGLEGSRGRARRSAIERCTGAIIESLESRCLLSGNEPLATFLAPLDSSSAVMASEAVQEAVTTTTTLTASTTSPIYGQSVTFTASVASSDDSVPTGAVAFLELDSNGTSFLKDDATQTAQTVQLLGVVNLTGDGTASLVCKTRGIREYYDWPLATIQALPSGASGADLYNGTRNIIAVYLGKGASLADQDGVPKTILNLSAGGLDTTRQASQSSTVSVDVKFGAGVWVVNRNALTPTSLPAFVASMQAPSGMQFSILIKITWRIEPRSFFDKPYSLSYTKPYTLDVPVPGSIQSNTAELTVSIPSPAPTNNSGGSVSYGSISSGGRSVLSLGKTIPMPTGTIGFYKGNTLLGTATLDSHGNAVFIGEKPLGTLGKHTIRAVYSGDDHFAAAEISREFTVTLAPTVTAMTASSHTVAQGGSTRLTVTVANADKDFVKPGGSVKIYDGSTYLTTLTLGAARQSLTLSLTPGQHKLRAVYAGDDNCLSSESSAVTLTVTRTGTVTPAVKRPVSVHLKQYGAATALHAPTFVVSLGGLKGEGYCNAPLPSTVWSAAYYSETKLGLPSGEKVSTGMQRVSGPPIDDFAGMKPGAPVPTSTVVFYDGKVRIGQAAMDASGLATFTPTEPLTPGKHSIWARYEGDVNYAAALSHTLQLTNQSKVATKMTISAPSGGGLVARVYSDWKNAIVPTGTLVLKEGSRTLSTLTLGKNHSNRTLELSPGKHVITAYYAGDGNCAPYRTTFTITVG